MGVFDDDTALVCEGDVWRGEVAPRRHVGAGPDGGSLATLPRGAMHRLSPPPDPLSTTTRDVPLRTPS